jgi:putative hydrolase
MRLLADLHVHSLASGHAYSTIDEIARAAAARGLELVAVTDHGPTMPGGPHEYYFGNLRVLPPKLHGVEILYGVEANILDEHGSVDLCEGYLQRMDIVLAGYHKFSTASMCKERNTIGMVNAICNKFVDIITHPGNPDFPIDAGEVVRAARDEGKALKINNSSFLVRSGSETACLEIGDLIRQHHVWVSISSDAHYAGDVGELTLAVDLARKAGIPEDLILNISAERVKTFLARRGKKRFTVN